MVNSKKYPVFHGWEWPECVWLLNFPRLVSAVLVLIVLLRGLKIIYFADCGMKWMGIAICPSLYLTQ